MTMTATIVPVGQARRASLIAVDWHGVTQWARRVVIVAVVVIGTVLLVRQAPTLGRGFLAAVHANPAGLILTGLLGAATYAAAAVAITAASGRSLRFGRTTAVQLAAACTNRLAPAGLGGMATNACYLQRDGATRTQAVAAVGVTSAASFVVHLIASVVVLVLVGQPVGGASIPLPSAMPLLVGLVLATAVGALLARRYGARITAAARELWAAVTPLWSDPRRLGHLVVGTVGVTLGHGLAFAVAASACGVHLSVLQLLAVFLAGSAIGSTAPTPGGLGALEAALVAGVIAFGAAAAPAVAGVLTYRLITYWLPILPGAIALKILRRDVLIRV